MLKLIGQYSDVILSLALVTSLIRLKIQFRYLAIAAFLLTDSFQSLLYLACGALYHRGIITLEYGWFWCFFTWIGWITTVWLVYALLISILRYLPGILRFSLRFFGFSVLLSLIISLLVISPEYAVAGGSSASFLKRLVAFTSVADQVLSMAEILAILSILALILRFPIAMPRNLAAFTAGLSVYLFFRIGCFLLAAYVPFLQHNKEFGNFPAYLMAGCLGYWIFSISAAGEEAQVTMGQSWRSVPKEHLVRQLEAMNAALLRSRQQS
jgi:hypothetical protein